MRKPWGENYFLAGAKNTDSVVDLYVDINKHHLNSLFIVGKKACNNISSNHMIHYVFCHPFTKLRQVDHSILTNVPFAFSMSCEYRNSQAHFLPYVHRNVKFICLILSRRLLSVLILLKTPTLFTCYSQHPYIYSYIFCLKLHLHL